MLSCAFNVLGAKPTDDRDALEDHYDEVRLLHGNTAETEDAFNELMNPRKRIVHEITYFERNVFEDFFKLLSFFQHTYKMSDEELSRIIVKTGKWFDKIDNSAYELYDKINNARILSGFSQVQDVNIILNEVDSLKGQCVDGITTYLDTLTNPSLVSLFNDLVKISDYECFLVDDLMSYYELKIKEDLQSKYDKCMRIFTNLERTCQSSLNFDTTMLSSEELSSLLMNFDSYYYKVNSRNEQLSRKELVAALKEYDYYAQPLQVNMQRHGGQHELSLSLVGQIRSKLIDLTNSSQDRLNTASERIGRMPRSTSIESYMYAMNVRALFARAVPRLLNFILFEDSLFGDLIDIFIELEIIADMLRNDRETLDPIISQLKEMNDTIKPKTTNSPQSSVSTSNTGHSSTPTGQKGGACYIATCVYGSYDCPEVWTLRRFRDYKLSKTAFGRMVISVYYKISPHLVKWFGNKKWFKKTWGFFLDRFVKRLHKKGMVDTPYEDLR